MARRRGRSEEPSLAVAYQLVACCDEGMDAMVLADGDGEPLLTTGDGTACRQVAAQLVKVGRKISDFQGTLFGPSEHWDVHLTRIEIEGVDLILWHRFSSGAGTGSKAGALLAGPVRVRYRRAAIRAAGWRT